MGSGEWILRDTLGAPLEHEGDPAGIWRYVNRDASAFQLPGVRLSADERIHSPSPILA